MSRPKHYFLRIFLTYTGLFPHYFMEFDERHNVELFASDYLLPTLFRLKQVHCFRNARFTATWKHLASEAVLSTQPSLKWSLIKSNRSSCKGSISWFFALMIISIMLPSMARCLRSSMNIAFFLCMHIIFWRLFSLSGLWSV